MRWSWRGVPGRRGCRSRRCSHPSRWSPCPRTAPVSGRDHSGRAVDERWLQEQTKRRDVARARRRNGRRKTDLDRGNTWTVSPLPFGETESEVFAVLARRALLASGLVRPPLAQLPENSSTWWDARKLVDRLEFDARQLVPFCPPGQSGPSSRTVIGTWLSAGWHPR